MNIDQAFPSRFLKAADLDEKKGAILTVDRVVMDNVTDSEEKPVIYFRETLQGLVLNKTNATMMKELYGPDTDAWAGRRILLMKDMVQFQGKLTPTIRIQFKRDNTGEPQTLVPVNTDPIGGETDDDLPF
jgi:hypothetical protein